MVIKSASLKYITGVSLLIILTFLTISTAKAHWPGHKHEHSHPHPEKPKTKKKEQEVRDRELYPSLKNDKVYEIKAEGPVSAGFGEASLLPGFPMVMSYGNDEPTKEFYDTAKVKTMLFEVEGHQFALLEYDVIGIRNEQAEMIKDTIAQVTDLKKRNIIVAATHNHSYGRTHKKRVYRLMARRGIRATRRALRSKFPAKIGFGKKKIPADLNLNRAELNGLANPLLYVIKVEDTTGHLRGLHYNYGSHPTVFTEWGSSRGKIGPNWPGYVNHYVQQRKRLDLLFERYSRKNGIHTMPFVMFSEGSAGDQQPRSTHIYLDGERQPGNKIFMEKLAMQVIDLVEDTETKRNADLHFKAKTHEMKIKNGDFYTTLLQTLVINNTALATIPGELNVELGYKFEKHSPYENNILLTNSDDYVGYIVREKIALESVTYQSKGIPFDPFFGERMINEAISMIKPGYEGNEPKDPNKIYGKISGQVEYDGKNKIAIGAMRKPATPNYGGGFFGQRTVVNEDGTYTIDSLASGQFFLYVMETHPDNPKPKKLKSGFSDIRALTYGVPVTVRSQQVTRNVNFQFSGGYTETGIESIELLKDSLEIKQYTLSGKLTIKGKAREEDVIEVRAYHAGIHYKNLDKFMQEPVVSTVVQKDGSFTFESLPKGRYYIAAFLDVNNNQLVEKKIDILTKPLNSPLIRIGEKEHEGGLGY